MPEAFCDSSASSAAVFHRIARIRSRKSQSWKGPEVGSYKPNSHHHPTLIRRLGRSDLPYPVGPRSNIPVFNSSGVWCLYNWLNNVRRHSGRTGLSSFPRKRESISSLFFLEQNEAELAKQYQNWDFVSSFVSFMRIAQLRPFLKSQPF